MGDLQGESFPPPYKVRQPFKFFPHPRIASEATSLRTFGPYGQKAHHPGGSTRGVSPLRTRFFGFVFLSRDKKMNNKPTTDRKLCSHYLPPSPLSPPPRINHHTPCHAFYGVFPSHPDVMKNTGLLPAIPHLIPPKTSKISPFPPLSCPPSPSCPY